MSTGIVGFSAQKRRKTSAVFVPTPGSWRSVFLASSKGIESIGVKSPWNFSMMIFETCFIVLALFLYKPATFKHSSILLVLAFANGSGVIWNWFERFSKALVVFLSAVFCEIIVTINVSKGSLLQFVHFGHVKVSRSVRRIFSALFFVICCIAFRNNKLWKQ